MVLAVALPSIFLRSCVISTYAIRSPSMEPALLTGDHLIVFREGIDARPLARWDVGLFDPDIDIEVPEGIEAVAKRIVGLGGEFLEIRDGDVYVGPRGALELVRKSDPLIRQLLVPVHVGQGLTTPWVGVGLEHGAGGTRISAGETEVWVLFGMAVRDGLDEDPGESPVSDTALRIVVGEGSGTLLLRLREGADSFEARLPTEAGGEVLLGHNLGGGVVARSQAPGLSPGSTLLFWNVDDGVRLWLDGELLLTYDYEENTSVTPGGPLNNVPAVGILGGERELQEVAVLRDLHYSGQGSYGTQPGGGTTPAKVPPGSVFLLGDYSRKSRDSRHFGPVSLSSLRGRPFATYSPLDRARWLGAAGVPSK